MDMLFVMFSTTITKLESTYIRIDGFEFSVLDMIIASIVLSALVYFINNLLHIND